MSSPHHKLNSGFPVKYCQQNDILYSLPILSLLPTQPYPFQSENKNRKNATFDPKTENTERTVDSHEFILTRWSVFLDVTLFSCSSHVCFLRDSLRLQVNLEITWPIGKVWANKCLYKRGSVFPERFRNLRWTIISSLILSLLSVFLDKRVILTPKSIWLIFTSKCWPCWEENFEPSSRWTPCL